MAKFKFTFKSTPKKSFGKGSGGTSTTGVKITWGNNQPLSTLSDLIQKRIKYTNESAKQAVSACMIDVLKSIRTITLKAKLSGAKPKVIPQGNLMPSWTKNGGKLKPCIRVKGSKQRLENIKLINAANGAKFDACHVFSFTDNRGDDKDKKAITYYIIAPSSKIATTRAKDFIKKRIKKYRGLAKLALGKLMVKIATSSISDQVSAESVKIAEKQTHIEIQNGNKQYGLTAFDNLDYALLALKGGQASLNTQLMKAANKISSVIKRKAGDDFFNPKFETPFPEVRSRK